MNKKVSTLLTVALTLGGSLLSSSAFANPQFGTAANEIEAGSQYLMVQEIGGKSYVYGFQVKSDGEIQQVVKEMALITDDELKSFAWEITEKQNDFNKDQYTYSFKNVGANAVLRTNNKTASADVEVITDGTTENTYDKFVFSRYEKYDGTNGSLAPHTVGLTTYNYFQFNDGQTPNDVSDDKLDFNQINAENVPTKFYKIESSEVTGDALNKLYNSKGFSFAVNTGVAGKVVEENPFQNLRAIDIENTVNAKEDDKNWGFPKGTYFVTKESYEAAKKATGNDYSEIQLGERKVEFLRSLTFIAVSSTQSIEVTGVDRANGQGFELVQISGNDLYDYIGSDLSKLPQNDQLSVYNACFHVEGLSTNSYPYSIKVKDFYFVADADALAEANGKGEDYEQTSKEVNLEVLKHGSPAAYYLTTSKASTDAAPFIFKFDESNIEKGISFLKTDAPAVYNIRFVSGDSDKTERGKYLTIGAKGSEFLSMAKGEALADAEALATPAYQYVITNVKDNDVTFTNRESGVSFTVKLYKEREENGKKIYSLSAVDCADWKISVVNIKDNSYGTEISDETLGFNDVEIELIESSVDVNSGYLNVADGTLMTIKYARDAYSTSNLWYAAVGGSDGKQLIKDSSTNEAYLSDDLSSAAQWQLVKADSVDLDRDYAYNNKNVVAVKGYGDKLKAYLYTFNYVTDGTATDLYLKGENGSLQLNATGDKYIIRKNPNGSVSLVKYTSTVAPFANDGKAFDYNAKETILEYKSSKVFGYSTENIYEAERGDNDLLTFLVNESPEISWKAEEGHVTIQAEGGDFLTMAENNDAIIVNENESDKLYLHVDKKGNGIIPSFYISKGYVEGSNAESERMFLYNPIDSVKYQVNMEYDPQYQLGKGATKAVFKSGKLNETRDTLSLTVKGEVAKKVAMKSNNQQNVWGGLNRFQFQIVETEDADGMYYIRQPKASVNGNTCYLANANDKAVWVEKNNSILPPYTFSVKETEAPTSNESVSASEVAVVAQNGSVVVKNAAGKNVVVSTILGQVVANEVLTSDNATINVPAGIVVVAVEGESFKVNVK